eukprot:TRINITY_DN10845_c0_g1_i2.p1 TRINITY_DN10845_c0_g1~~TRINITY_DN10845_c0_g1_i2.p1  ORF type:complete len:343 (-),score=66.45 TRINITY_DN10845_c0_g1_i2:355-1383(-)
MGFGGYWRTRMFTQDNFTGTELDNSMNVSRIDTRTRLYYTAVLNDNLKFVNKFEFNTVWDDNDGGDIGSDAANNFRIKNSYVDANLGMVNTKIGQQGITLARGFIFDDDYSGINLTVAGATSLVYMKIDENGQNIGSDNQAYAVAHAIKTDAFTVVPLALYADLADENYIYILGADVNANLGAASVWGSFYYEGGVADDANDVDISAYLLAVGGNMNLSDMLGLHGQVFYATGDDADKEMNAWTGVPGRSYYWSEIMGLGTFDNQMSSGACGDQISNITAINLGTTVKLSDKLSVDADLWYAMLNEDDANGEDTLGTELDLKATYMLIDGLKLEVIAAYLFC